MEKGRAGDLTTVSNRVAQMVVKNRLEKLVDPRFLSDSYDIAAEIGVGCSGTCRADVLAYDWVCDLDIKGFFDNLNHELMMRAVRKHAKEKWALLYIERWLKAHTG